MRKVSLFITTSATDRTGATNPALPVDGGIAIVFHVEWPRPAATEEQRSATIACVR